MSTRVPAPLLGVLALASLGGSAWLALRLLRTEPISPEHQTEASGRSGALVPAPGAAALGVGEDSQAPVADAGSPLPSRSSGAVAEGPPVLVRGRVSLPPGLPADERVVVFAVSHPMGARALQDPEGPASSAWEAGQPDGHEDLLAVSEPDELGEFRLELPANQDRAHLALIGRYLFSPATLAVDLPITGVTLAPEFGACITGQLVAPGPAGADGSALEDVAVEFGPDIEQGFDTVAMNSKISARAAKSDSRGAFELRAVPTAGVKAIRIKPERFAARVERGLALEPGQHRELSIPLLRGATVEGEVRDEQGAPLAGAVVGARLRGIAGRTLKDVRESTTGEDGRFTLEGVTPGPVEVHVRADGYREASERPEARLVDGERRVLGRIELDRGVSLSGKVLYPDGTPAGGARVVATLAFNAMSPMNGDMEREFLTTTEADGGFVVQGLSDVRYRLRASHEEDSGAHAGKWQARSESVEGGRSDVVVKLEAPIELTGRVSSLPTGEPIQAFRVSVTLKGSGMMFGIGAERSDKEFSEREDGSFTLENLGPGTWEVSVRADGFGSSPVQLVSLPQANSAAPVECVLPPAGQITGRVLDSEGLPVSRASVAPELDLAGQLEGGERVARMTALTDAEGRFIIGAADPGSVNLVAKREGWAASEPTPCEVVAGETTSDVVLRLRRGGTLTGEVLGEDGRPDSGATIIVQRTPSLSAQHMLRSNTDGQFHMDRLEPGTWQVLRTMDLFGDNDDLFSGDDSDAMSKFVDSLEFEVVDLVDGESVHVVIGAPPEDPVQLSGTVTEAGEAVPKAMINLVPDGAASVGEYRLKVTDAEGYFEVELDKAGYYHITVQLGEDNLQQRHVEFLERIPEGVEAHSVELKLPLGRITGKVSLAGKGPVRGSRVTLRVDGGILSHSYFGGQFAETITDEEGNYELKNLRPGQYSVAVGGQAWGGLLGGGGEGGREVISGLQITEGGWLEGVDFEVEPAGKLAGVVRDLDGRPVKGAAVFVRDDEGRLMEQFSLVETDPAGKFEFGNLAPGLYRVSARIGGRASRVGDSLRVRAEGSDSANITLEPGTLLRISVSDAEGEPLRNLLRVLDDEGRDYASMLTIQEVVQGFSDRISRDQRVVGPLPHGQYKVQVVLEDGTQLEKPVRLTGRPERKVSFRAR